MSIFEVTMLLCFGAAWPSSIYKSYISRTSKGKSGVFLVIVFTGYIAGILHKTFFNPDWVVLLYSLNALMVFLDILLYMRNSVLDRQLQS
ncbi:MAG: hypothetical protein JXM72_06520 [Deltaproteobacteria bacterium]|nr:hypothetical protein [Deltaproteobacteria bacterium]